jgi:phosphate/sulfate permease
MKGIAAGIIAGICGAVVWSLIAALTGFEIGWIAWGIGAAVGAAVAWGSEGSPKYGVIAVIISVISILAGKYIAVEMVLADELKDADQEVNRLIENEEYLISWLADSIIYERMERDEPVAWPAGVDPEQASEEQHYPPEIWNDMDEEERDEFKVSVRQQIDTNVKTLASEVKKQGFIESFSVIDIVFFILAVLTAYKMGAKTDAPAPASVDHHDSQQPPEQYT